MDDPGFIKSHFVGRDGFIWWIGQVVSEKAWVANLPGNPFHATLMQQRGFDFRYKVRIMGYHTCNPEDLPDEELPWASVMLPVTSGVSGGASGTPNLRQGNFVYGFFMDGEDAQQPIIMGVIGYSQYTAILKDAPEDETCTFLPFSGYRTEPTKVPGNSPTGEAKADKVSTRNNPTTQEEPPAVAERVDVSKTNNDSVLESNLHLYGTANGADKEQYENEKEPVYIASSPKCEQSPMVGIQRAITNMNNKIHRYKKTLTDWETKVSTTLPDGVDGEISKVKDNTTKEVSGHLKVILNEILKNTTKKVNNVASDSFDQVFPTELPEIYQKVDEANDALACAFKNIMKNLTGMTGGFLDKATDRMVTTPPCAVNDMSGDLLGKISGLVDDTVDKSLQPLKSTLDGMGVATDAISDVMGFVSDAVSFLQCDEDPKCTDVKEWNSVKGAEPPVTFNMNELVSKARAAKEAFKAAAEAAGQLIDLDNFDFNLDFADTFTKLGSSVGDCNVGPRECGPPTIEFSGGGGSGAKGNAIISAATTLLGIDIVTPGGGYITPPKIIIRDACDKGKGAVARAILGPVDPVITRGLFTGDVTVGSPIITNVTNPAVINVGTTITAVEGLSTGEIVLLGTATVIAVSGDIVTIDQSFVPVGDLIPSLATDDPTVPTTDTLTFNYVQGIPPNLIVNVDFNGDIIAGSNQIRNVSNLTNISPGMNISLIRDGAGVTLSTGGIVTAVDGTTVTLDRPFSGTGSVSDPYPALFSGTGVGSNATGTGTGGAGTATGTGTGGAGTGENTTTGAGGVGSGEYPPGTNLGVVQIVIEDSGVDYLPSADGSKGGSGRTWANKDETVVKRGGNFPTSDGIPGIYDVPHKPGDVVQLYPGDEFTPPGGATELITESTSKTCPDLPSTGIKPGVFPTTGSGEYPVVLEIDDITILDRGFGYDCSKDKVIVEPANGAELSIKCDPLGSIIGVNVINGGIGFTDDPLVYIKSDTGYNAELMPVFKVNRVGEDVTIESIAPSQIVQVIDCVGKFQ